MKYIEKVTKEIAEKKMKTPDICRKLGISRVSWWNILNGNIPKFRTIQRMTRLFSVQYEDFETPDGELEV